MRRLLILLTILIVLSCVATYIYKNNFDLKKQNEMNRIAEEYNKVLKELREDKEKLNQNIEVLKKEIIVEGMGSTIILLSDTNSNCLKDTVPLLDDFGYYGVICIDDSHSPIDEVEGYLSKEEINELISKGYELVLNANSNTNVINLYNKYINAGYDIKGFYFPNDDMSANQLLNIKELGIEYVLLYGEERNDKEVITSKVIGSMYQNAKSEFEDGVASSKTIALSIGYGRSIDTFNEENIRAMLKVIKKHVDAGNTAITNISEAKQRYDDYLDYLINSSQNEKIKNIEELENRLQEIEEKLATYVLD